MHTNLILGANWAPDEWPDYVEVSHDGEAGGRRYAPERTCHSASAEELGLPGYAEGCSECGFRATRYQFDHVYNYCPNCGARVVKEER